NTPMRYQLSPFVSLFVAIFLLNAAGCREAPPAIAPEAPEVTGMHREKRELSDNEEFNGWMAAEDKVEVRSRVKGHIQKVYFTDGQYVTKEELVFTTHP